MLVPSIEAVILVVPSLCTLIRPFEEMVAIFSLLEDQIIFWDADFWVRFLPGSLRREPTSNGFFGLLVIWIEFFGAAVILTGDIVPAMK